MSAKFWKNKCRELKRLLKFLSFLIGAYIFAQFLVTKPDTTLSMIGALLVGMAVRKNWFILFFSYVAWNDDESDFAACAKRFADWLEKLSVAAIIPFLGAALLDERFLPDKVEAVRTAALIVIICFFCSMRFTKYVAEGVHVFKNVDDARDFLRCGKYKEKIDGLSDTQIQEIMNAPIDGLYPTESAGCHQPQRTECPRTNRSRVCRRKIRPLGCGTRRRHPGVGQSARRPS